MLPRNAEGQPLLSGWPFLYSARRYCPNGLKRRLKGGEPKFQGKLSVPWTLNPNED